MNNVNITNTVKFLLSSVGTAILVILLANPVAAQSRPDKSSRSMSGTIKLPSGTSAPGTCTTGQVFFDTDATAGSNLTGCTATNTWTTQGGSVTVSDFLKAPVAFASIPACSTSIFEQRFTDAPYLARCNGSSTYNYWTGDAYSKPATQTVFGTAVNITTATKTDDGNGTYSLVGESSAGVMFNGWCKSIPSAPYTITVQMSVIFPIAAAKYPTAGIALRQSSDGKIIQWGPQEVNGTDRIQYGADKLTNATTYSGASYSPTVQSNTSSGSGPFWIRIKDDNTDRKFYHSQNGTSWFEVLSHSRTDFLTADQMCLFVNSNSSSVVPYAWYHSYLEQ